MFVVESRTVARGCHQAVLWHGGEGGLVVKAESSVVG
jgi:CxxC motif-containing protein (DUF1111 family)